MDPTPATPPDPRPTETRPTEPVPAGARGSRKAYWRANLRLLAVLLAIWFVVSYGFGVLLAEPLNAFKLGGAPLGFWFAQQGAIYVFVVLIAVYVIGMSRLDRAYGVREA